MSQSLAQSLHDALCAAAPAGTPLLLSSISPELKKARIDPKAHGFGKLLPFLQAFSVENGGFLRIDRVSTVEQTGASVFTATVVSSPDPEFDPVQSDSPALTPFDFTGAAHDAANTQGYRSAPVPEAERNQLGPDFQAIASLPGKARGYLAEAVRGVDDFEQFLGQAWAAAWECGAIRYFEGKVIFPIPVMRSDGTTPVEVSMRLSGREGQKPWFVSYIDTAVHEPPARRVSPSQSITSFAYLGPWDSFLSELAAMALPEAWDFTDGSPESVYDAQTRNANYPILRSYISTTFFRLQQEGKICITAEHDFAAFNTGLVNKRFDDIYACFKPNNPSARNPWMFCGFCVQGSGHLGKRIVSSFNPLPQTATYFEHKEDLLFDTDRSLIINYDHVIVDNMARLPVAFLEEGLRGDAEALELLEGLRNNTVADREDALKRVRELLENNDAAFMYLRVRLDDAIQRARKRVRWNYKTAIPMYYPRANTMSLLLPICLTSTTRADAALVVELMESGNYQGQTVLTMRQAYQDARLVCRPDSDWLTPSSAS